MSTAGDAHELEANRVADRVARGEPSGVVSEAPRAEVSRLDAWDVLNIGTGGAAAQREVTKDSSGLQIFNDLTSSIALAVKYMPDEFKALFPAKDDLAGWWNFIQVTEGLLGAQLGVLILTGVPDPTFATKLAALVLQALIITFLIVISVQLGVDSIATATKWWDTVKDANGDPHKVDAAARLFAHLVANLIQIIGAIADMAKVAKPREAPEAPKAPKRPTGSVEEAVPAGKAEKAIEHTQANEHHVPPPANVRNEHPHAVDKDGADNAHRGERAPGGEKAPVDEVPVRENVPVEEKAPGHEKAPPEESVDEKAPEESVDEKAPADARIPANEKAPAKDKTPKKPKTAVKAEYRPCFVAGTQVPVEGGVVAIERIARGMSVLARHEESATPGYQSVTATHGGATRTLFHVRVGVDQVTSTAHHPFYVRAKGWVLARDLVAGDQLESITGEAVEISAIAEETLEVAVATFNMTVADASTYFVYLGGRAVLVHNGDAPNLDGELYWFFGSQPRARLPARETVDGVEVATGGDTDGISMWKTNTRTEVNTFFATRVSNGAKPGDAHGCLTPEQLAGQSLVAPETAGDPKNPLTGKLLHHSIRPATNPDPGTPEHPNKLSDPEILKLDASAKAAQAAILRPRELEC